VSRYGPTGKSLVMAKKYEDAVRFTEAYRKANLNTPGFSNPVSYTSRFNNPAIIAARNQRHAADVAAMQERSRTMGFNRSNRLAASQAQKTWGQTLAGFFKPAVI